MNPTVAFHTLGCKLNFAETSSIAAQLKEAGFEKADFESGADVVVINTCSVTENADRECRMIIRRALERNPESFIAVTGCYAQLKPEEIASMEGVDLVLGAKEKFNITSWLDDLKKRKAPAIHTCTIGEVDSFHHASSAGERTRAFLKVQDGCDFPCTYCTIPLARGGSRSAPVAEIVDEAKRLVDRGFSEVVLTGVNIGDYGIFTPGGKYEARFIDLLQSLEQVEGILRYRISSIEPNLLSNDIIDFIAASNKFAPHLHIPLQSGSDKVLGLMKRRYRSSLYADRVERIKSQMPHACIGADVITGFPGETEEDFLETYRFLNELPVSYLHVFTYSERENTPAVNLPGYVEPSERKRRNKMLRILSEKKRQHFYAGAVGREYTVLFEEGDGEMMEGFSENYIRMSMPYDASFLNQPVYVRAKNYYGSSSVNVELTPVFAG